MLSIASILGLGSDSYPCYFFTIDNIPPIFLGCPFAPIDLRDDFGSQFEWHASPGGRFQYPIFKTGTPRIVSFQLRFDGEYPINPKIAVGNPTDAAYNIKIAMSVLEKLRIPKVGPAQIAAGVMGTFLRVRPGDSDPAPPLTVFVFGEAKIYLGYMGQAKIRQIRFNKKMQCVRFISDCEFYVTPDLIVSLIDDIEREIYALLGLF